MREFRLTLRVRLTPMRKRRRLADVSQWPSSRIGEKNEVDRVVGCQVIDVAVKRNINRCVVDDVLFLGVFVRKERGRYKTNV